MIDVQTFTLNFRVKSGLDCRWQKYALILTLSIELLQHRLMNMMYKNRLRTSLGRNRDRKKSKKNDTEDGKLSERVTECASNKEWSEW